MDRDGTEPIEDTGISGGEGEGAAGLTELVAAVERLTLEVEGLNARIERLEGTRPSRSRSAPARGRRRSTPSESVEVVIRPVPELAMVAVAERALRRAEAVHSVEKADGSGDEDHEARYRVEIRPGSDLVGEVGEALPVAFQASEGETGVLFFDLKW